MEIGAVMWKGKGKDKKRDKETRVWFTCGKPGHLSTACWFKDNSTEGSKGKGKGKHKDGNGQVQGRQERGGQRRRLR